MLSQQLIEKSGFGTLFCPFWFLVQSRFSQGLCRIACKVLKEADLDHCKRDQFLLRVDKILNGMISGIFGSRHFPHRGELSSILWEWTRVSTRFESSLKRQIRDILFTTFSWGFAFLYGDDVISMYQCINVSMYLCIYLSMYLSIYLPIYLSVCLSVYLSIYLTTYLPIYLPTYLSIYLSVCLSIYLPTYLSVYLSIYLPTYLSVCLSIYLSICLPTHLSIYLSIYLSTIYLSIYLSNLI